MAPGPMMGHLSDLREQEMGCATHMQLASPLQWRKRTTNGWLHAGSTNRRGWLAAYAVKTCEWAVVVVVRVCERMNEGERVIWWTP